MAQPLTRANTSKQTVTKTISGDATQVQPLSMMPPGGGNPFNIPNRIFLVPNRGLYHKEAPISSVTPEGLWPWAVVHMLLSRFVPASLEAWHSESVLLPSMHTTLEELFDRRNLWSRAAATMLPLEPLKPIRALKKRMPPPTSIKGAHNMLQHRMIMPTRCCLQALPLMAQASHIYCIFIHPTLTIGQVDELINRKLKNQNGRVMPVGYR